MGNRQQTIHKKNTQHEKLSNDAVKGTQTLKFQGDDHVCVCVCVYMHTDIQQM